MPLALAVTSVNNSRLWCFLWCPSSMCILPIQTTNTYQAKQTSISIFFLSISFYIFLFRFPLSLSSSFSICEVYVFFFSFGISQAKLFFSHLNWLFVANWWMQQSHQRKNQPHTPIRYQPTAAVAAVKTFVIRFRLKRQQHQRRQRSRPC